MNDLKDKRVIEQMTHLRDLIIKKIARTDALRKAQDQVRAVEKEIQHAANLIDAAQVEHGTPYLVGGIVMTFKYEEDYIDVQYNSPVLVPTSGAHTNEAHKVDSSKYSSPSYVVNVNHVHKYAKIHRSDCRHWLDAQPSSHGTWSKHFDGYGQAFKFAETHVEQSTITKCEHCF